MRNDIAYRVKAIISSEVDENRRSKALEEETGIPATNWKNFWTGKQKPTIDMIEAIARRWPEYAFWLATGITDQENGHTAPQRAWTCGQLKSTKEVADTARDYFNLNILIQNSKYGFETASILQEEDCDIENPTIGKSTEEGKYFISTKKPKELDSAIAEIAFNKRQDELIKYYFSQNCLPDSSVAYKRLFNLLQLARVDEKARKLASEMLQANRKETNL
ncbi:MULTISPECIES: hypothetical protein [Deefgea]|uniref:XRE family transcriptional regulator n=1 Tax=Deefgea chitinilytica TaxID=570276 RepID=A0ABS2C8S2_9NEIS|nr:MULTISPECIES: hypothetical protein [Deefgea]MBM5570549.1 hypothetical protein [Deefgea chitinilytica]MBM9887778.1 hypothetical protein [Deefgea sp. CFH1-16]